MLHPRIVPGVALVLMGAAALAGCLTTDEPEQSVEPDARADCGPAGTQAGYGQTGSTDEGQVGTGTGDIGSSTACINESEDPSP